MTTKIITKQCEKCEYMKNDDSASVMFCSWGKSKKKKRLMFPQNKEQKRKDCALIERGN